MKVTYSWLKEFVDFKMSPEKLGEVLSMAGLTVASCEPSGSDMIYDIEVTSNRPDWLSVRGIAREVAAATGKACRLRRARAMKARGRGAARVTVEDPGDCRLYFGRLISGVRVGASPAWLIKRLEMLGVRSINNIVDITNYCLLEYGQPLHAFDFDRIKDRTILVRRAKKGETLVLIDGNRKELDGGILVIADRAKPLAVAGLMGGLVSEVGLTTTNILLESACFNPVVIRRMSRALGTVTDSSYRFERGVDLVTVREALEAATRMILELCGGRLETTTCAGSPAAGTAVKIKYDIREARDVLSLDIGAADAARIFKGLGFGVRRKMQGRLEVSVPTFRRDVRVKEDLTEEIARIYGYDRIPLTQTAIKPFLMETPVVWKVETAAREILSGAGLKEIIAFGLVSEADYEQSGVHLDKDAFCLKNPLSQDYRILRTTLLPGLLQCAAHNVKYGNLDFEIFEVAHIFRKKCESLSVAVLLCGNRRSDWTRSSVPYDFFDAKGLVGALLERLGIDNWHLEPCEESFLEDGSAAGIVVAGRRLGVTGSFRESAKKALDIKHKKSIFVAEIDLEAASGFADFSHRARAIAATPSLSRDISVLVPQGVSFGEIRRLIEERTKGFLRRVRLVERYEGKELPAGMSALTVSLEYGLADRTLRDEEIFPVHQGVLDALTKDLALVLR